MSLALPAARAPLSVPKRWLLFGAAAVLGFLGGYGWSVEASVWVYNLLLETFVNPSAPIEPMAMGIGLGFLLGFIHISAI